MAVKKEENKKSTSKNENKKKKVVKKATKKTTSKEAVKTKKTVKNKNVSSKSTPKKKVVDDNKNISKDTIKTKKESFFKSTKFLTIVFVVLIILVIVLSALVIDKKKKESSTFKANIILSLVSEDDAFDFGINAKELSKAKVYSFKVANYRGKKINKKELNYLVTIKNNTDSEIKITKNGSEENLMKEQKNTVIENNKLLKGEKFYDYYIVTMKKSGKLKNKDFIHINVKANK